MDRKNDPNADPHHRRQSRLTREMNAARANPFYSPPSSTGSHGTVTTTSGDLTRDLTTFSFEPVGESTRNDFGEDQTNRKLHEGLKAFNQRKSAAAAARRAASRPKSIINTSVLAATFPEWASLAKKDNNNNSTTQNITQPPAPIQPAPASIPIVEEETTKDNVIPPPSEDTVPVEQLINHKRALSRAEMQPRVETCSNSSTATKPRRVRVPSAPLSPLFGSPVLPERQTLKELAARIRPTPPVAASQKQPSAPGSTKQKSPVSSPKRSSTITIKESPYRSPQQRSVHAESRSGLQSSSPPKVNKSGFTGRTFVLPPLRHLPDLTSGTLKFSSMRDGVPVFVKHGKARTQIVDAGNEHETVEAINVPGEDKDIFVSMDNIREEVRQLQEHDEMVQKEAENLQTEVERLHNELKRFKQRKASVADSAFGSGSESEGRTLSEALSTQRRLYDEKIAELQRRIEQASRKVGVHDIHSAALTAERDEALQEASMARERARKLEAELQSTQKDLSTNMGYRQEKETLELENTSLRANADALRQQHDSVATNYKTLGQQNDKLRQDNATLQRELSSIRQELENMRLHFDSVQEEKMMLAEDHGSLERSNDTYFKENKNLRAKLEADNQRIADLEKGLARRDQIIEEMQANMTTHTVQTEPAGLRQQYAALEDEVKRLRDRHIATQKESDEVIRAKEERIRFLMQEVSGLQDQITSTYQLKRENIRLQEELKELRDREGAYQQVSNKNARLVQSEDYLKQDVEQLQQELHERETTWLQEKTAMTQEIQRKEAELKAAQEMAREITDQVALNLININTSSKPSKVARVIEPSQQLKDKYSASEPSVRSEALEVEEDPTTEVNMPTQQADMLSIFSDDGLPKLNQQLGQVDANRLQDVQNTQNIRSKSDNTTTIQKQKQPASILKKSSQFAQDDTMTGNYSVRSGHSAISRASKRGDEYTAQSHVSARSITNDLDQNMTSAFILPDITLRGKARSISASQQPGPALSKEARSVLDGVCIHNSRNCTVCSRIHGQSRAQGSSGVQKAEANTKKRVRVQKPTPATERRQHHAEEYVEEPTLRPSMPPGDALAIVIKELQDEIAHIEVQIQEQNKYYFGLDKAIGQRERRRALMAVQKLQREYESKSAQVYKLHDVLEGQKQAGQLMTQEELDVTIASICGPLDVTATQTQESARSSVRGSTVSEFKGFD
ncbi:hypothetical protein DL546_008473 [Coniochaeta pulveracea]|uniref:Cep57 centrosome microtubule-binding domain-containing protein n=1 Tax=Coniochaeta pulveracea TaxID=177199 RepID=A0A420YKH3_9PEZI|nr:hypothetical protein DL546_008473 [Coniochaeta pulveracea]